MQPYQQRVVDERACLEDKVGKLVKFLFGEVFNSLPPEERNRLTRQYAYMKMYLDVLDERIAAF